MIPTWFPYKYSKELEMFEMSNCNEATNIVVSNPASVPLLAFTVPKTAQRAFITAIQIFNTERDDGIGSSQIKNSATLFIDKVPCSNFRDRIVLMDLFQNGPCWITPIKLKALQNVVIKLDSTNDLVALWGCRVWGFYDYLTAYDLG